MMSEQEPIPCPTCKKAVAIPDGEKLPHYFPFCSERCKLIDLGRWLDGKYQIPVAEPEHAENLPSEAPDESY